MFGLKHVFQEQAGADGAAGGAAAAEGAGAGGAAMSPTTGASASPAANAPWFDSFDPEIKNFAAVKQWKDPAEAVRSFMNAEKLLGVPAESVIKIPKADDAEGWSKVHEKLGRPAKAEDYQLPIPDGDAGEYSKMAAEWMHKAGLSTAQAQALAKMNNEYAQQVTAKQAEAAQAKTQADLATLKTEWGVAYQKKIDGARQVAKEFNISGETIDALEGTMGFAGVMRFMDSLAAKVGEDRFVSGGNGAGSGAGFDGAMTPAQAQGQIAALKGDSAFITKFLNGDVEAKARMQSLHKMAYPDG